MLPMDQSDVEKFKRSVVEADVTSLLSPEDVEKLVQKIARNIDDSLDKNSKVMFVGVLKGAWVFLADLVREFSRPCKVDFIRARSYGDATVSSGSVQITKDIESDPSGYDVFLVEDIIDTGRTLMALKSHFENKGARSVKLVAFLDKKERREVECHADYVGLEIPDKFVIGYGLDWAERFRDLKGVYQVTPHNS